MKRQLAGWLQQFAPLRWALQLAVRIFAPRQFVGAVGVVFNDAGQVLLVEHVFRPHYPWGLPGGWVGPGEHPAQGVQRELMEELGLQVTVKDLLVCEPQGRQIGAPTGLGLAYYCRLANPGAAPQSARHGYEVLSLAWVDPHRVPHRLTPIDRKAIRLACEVFEREQARIRVGD